MFRVTVENLVKGKTTVLTCEDVKPVDMYTTGIEDEHLSFLFKFTHVFTCIKPSGEKVVFDETVGIKEKCGKEK